MFSTNMSEWNFNYKYFCSSEGKTLSSLAKDLNEGNNCGKTVCEHGRFCQKEKSLRVKKDEGELSEFLLD